jgi:hypothetical protein
LFLPAGQVTKQQILKTGSVYISRENQQFKFSVLNNKELPIEISISD